MAKGVKRGFWYGPEGKAILHQIRGGVLAVEQAAKQLKTTRSAVENALSRTARMAPAVRKPSRYIQSSDKITQLADLATEMLGEAILERRKELEAQLQVALGRVAELEKRVGELEADLLSSESRGETLEVRMADRLMAKVGVVHGE